MKKVKIFYAEETPYHPGKFLIRADLDKFHCYSTSGSFVVLPARIFGLQYQDYLRMCRDVFGAEIVGKNSSFPLALFKRSEGLKNLLEHLNTRANYVLWEREHPDFQEHANYVKEKNPKFYAEVTGNVYNS